MLRLSYWQWERYLSKNSYIIELKNRVSQPIVPLEQAITEADGNWSLLLHRRVHVTGTWDFEHEIIKRNRKDNQDGAGVHVITPLHVNIENFQKHAVLINRGYIPYTYKSLEKRKRFQNTAPTEFTGLIKLSEEPRWFLSPTDKAPSTPTDRLDEWLRVDIHKISKQTPYKLLPIHIELMNKPDAEQIQKDIVVNSKSREEIFYITDTEQKVRTGALSSDRDYPVPAYSTVVPSATHLLYVYEWAFMALLTLLIGLILQLNREHKLLETP